MRYKLNAAVKKYNFLGKKWDSQQLFCLFMCIGIGVLFVLAYRATGSWWAPLRWWWKLLQETWKEDGLFLASWVVIFGLGIVLFVGSHLRTALLWKTVPLDEENKFESIDFQPATFVLQGPKPVVLPYDQTVMRLLIYVTKQKIDDVFVKKVSMLSLCFMHEKDVYICNNFCTEKGIFPLLEYIDRFASFSYEFNDMSAPKNKKIMPQGHAHLFQDRPSNIRDVQYYASLLQKDHAAGDDSLDESHSSAQIQPVPHVLNNGSKTNRPSVGYKSFVKEQIQNHLQTLSPYSYLSSKQVVNCWTGLITLTIFIGYILYHLIFTAPYEPILWTFVPPVILLTCVIMVYLAVKLWRHYRAKSKLEQMKK